MGDQAMATLGDADWSEESHMDECDPGAPLDMVAEESTRRYDDLAQETCRTGLLANIGRCWCRPTGNLSPK